MSFSISQNETQPAVFATMTFSVGICRVDLQVAYIHYIYIVHLLEGDNYKGLIGGLVYKINEKK